MGRRRWGGARAGPVAGLLLVAVLGCTAPSPFDAEPDASDDAGDPDAAVPDGAADDGDEGATDPGASIDPETNVCNEAVVLAAGETIDGQIGALGAADFESALHFASRRFQAEVEPAIFEAIITSQYPILLEEPAAEFGPCAQVADLARIEVTVTATNGTRAALVYLLVREEGRWSIDGAASIDGPARELV